jgi:hypothetical protein
MHSIHRALLWESFAKGWWTIPFFSFVGVSIPLLTNAALSSAGLPWSEPIWIMLQFSFLMYLVVASSVGIIDAHGSATRLYTIPISNRSIVLWHALTGACVLAAEVALFCVLANALFRSNWPILGPSLAAGVCWVLTQPLVHSTKRTIVGTLLSTLPLVLFACWVHSRFGSWFGRLTHPWDHVTAEEVLTMLGFIIFAYFQSLFVIAKDRCGEGVFPIEHWLTAIRATWSRSKAETPQLAPFRSPSSALFWYEWRQKGLALPLMALIFFGILGTTVAFKLWSKPVEMELFEDVREGIFGLGMFMVAVSGFAGLFFAIASIRSSGDPSAGQFLEGLHVYDLGSFQSTKPVASRLLANALLKTCGLSVLLTWAIWMATFLLLVAFSVLMGQPLQRIAPESIGLSFFPMILVLSWIAMTVVTFVGISGRGAQLIALGSIAFGFYIALSIALEQLAPRQISELAQYVIAVLVSVAAIAYCVLTATVAARSKQVPLSTIYAMIGISITLVLATYAIAPKPPSSIGWLAILAMVSLAVHPLAAFPMAFASNRTR